MNIIFLDFDGVVVTHRTQYLDLDPVCMTPLQRIVNTTRASIVISSSWRAGRELQEFQTSLERFGLGRSVIGMTPLTNGMSRGREIQLWLQQHPEVDSFVILDDDADMDNLIDRLVQTEIETGLTEQDADRAIELLTA